MTIFLFDTNIISLLFRRNLEVERRAEVTFASNETVILSPVVLYEAKRGLIRRDAKKQMAFLDRLVSKFTWLDLARADWDEAARLWAERTRTGKPIDDADLLIAVQAKRLGAILVTDNEKDFDGLGVVIENWRK